MDINEKAKRRRRRKGSKGKTKNVQMNNKEEKKDTQKPSHA